MLFARASWSSLRRATVRIGPTSTIHRPSTPECDQRRADPCAHRDRDSALINSPANIAGTYANTATVDFAADRRRCRPATSSFLGRGCPADSMPGSRRSYPVSPVGKVALDRSRRLRHQPENATARPRPARTACSLAWSRPATRSPSPTAVGQMFVPPSLVIQQAPANLIKANIAAPVNVTIRPTPGSLW